MKNVQYSWHLLDFFPHKHNQNIQQSRIRVNLIIYENAKYSANDKSMAQTTISDSENIFHVIDKQEQNDNPSIQRHTTREMNSHRKLWRGNIRRENEEAVTV